MRYSLFIHRHAFPFFSISNSHHSQTIQTPPLMASSTTGATTGTKSALLISAATSAAASVFFIREFVPSSVQDSILSSFSNLLSKFSTQITVIVEESDGLSPNRMYKAAELYLSMAVVPSDSAARRLKVNVAYDEDESMGEDPDTEDVRAEAMQVTIDRGEEVVDVFRGVKFVWRVAVRETNSQSGFRGRGRYGYFYDGRPSEVKYFELVFHKKHKDLTIKSYLPHVLNRAKAIREEAKTLKLYTNDDEMWTPVKFRHPATFASVAMNEQKKQNLIDDLSRFLERKEYYKRIGKAWKRGYLLYGPPGTGKSTLIAAMANFLRFDIYDLELTEVRSNASLRSLLINTSSRSILVIEDIDCSADLQQREEKKKKPNKDENNPHDEDSKVTLSGLLNFVDGLWSSCGDERIIIFTTNYKDKLDPALLRPGRMDMHIHMGFCDSAGFRVLASHYHNIETHPLFEEIDELIKRVEVTPAEIAEGLMRSDDVEIALNGLIGLIKEKEREISDGKKKESEDQGLGVKKESQEEISEEEVSE